MTNNNYYNYDCNNNHNTSNNNHNGNINAFSCNFNIESNFLYCTSVRQLLRQRLINVEPAVVCGLHILLVHGLRTAVPCISCCWWRHLPCYLSWPLPSVWFLQHILSLTATGCALNIGCTKNYQPIEVTVHSHCVESKVSYSDVGEREALQGIVKKTQFFLNTQNTE